MGTLDLDTNPSTYQIRAYNPGHIQINELILTKSVIVAPHELIENWAPQTIDELSANTLSPVIALKPDVLLIGTGGQLIFLPPTIYGHLINLGIGVEIMDTRAACHTFNALSAESRRVVAALIIR